MAPSFEEQVRDAISPGDKRGMAGVQFTVIDKTGTLYDESFGHHTIEENSPPMTPDSIVWFASCTKLLTSLSALQCVERGLFSLDEDASRLLPELKETKYLAGWEDPTEKTKPIFETPKNKITPRQLLTHTSGFVYRFLYPDLLPAVRAMGMPAKDMVSMDEIKRSPIVFQPGEGWSYGTGIDWAGLLVARAANTTLGEYFEENIYKPLGIQDMTFYLSKREDLMEKLMLCLFHDPATGELKNAPINRMMAEDELGGGGLYGSGRSYVKILRAVLNEDERILKKKETWDLAFTDQIGDQTVAPQKNGPLNLSLTYNEYEKTCERVVGKDNVPEGGPKWGHTLVGSIALSDVPGWIRKGTVAWGGAANNNWWVDRQRGLAFWMNTQSYPYEEPNTVAVKGAFMGEMLKRFDKSG